MGKAATQTIPPDCGFRKTAQQGYVVQPLTFATIEYVCAVATGATKNRLVL
jgi:hypothetical protein